MDILDYLKTLRRRWRVLLVVATVAATAALLTAPGPQSGALPVGTTYTATTTLLRAPDVQQADLSLVRLYVRTGEIPQLVAEKLGWEGPPATLAARVTVGGDDEVGTVTIGTTSENAREAERIADTFAEQTIAFLVASAEARQERAIRSTSKAITAVTEQLADVDSRIRQQAEGSTQRAVLEAQRQALISQLQNLYGRMGELTSATATASPLNVLEKAQGYPQVSGAPSLEAPRGRTARLILGLLLGLGLGAAAALLIERLDTRLQNREGAESAFGLPVIAEIPHLSRHLRRTGAVVTATVPESAAAEAFRGLRAALLLMPSRVILGTDNPPPREPGGRVVLVTAPTPRSGKTTTAVNLAVALAESGRRVLVIDADFRNPAVHHVLSVKGGIGLTDVAVMGDVGRLDRVIQHSKVAPVQVLPAGSRTLAGSTIEAALPAIVGAARQLADVVVIDSAPLLAGSDALDVLPHVDTVVMVGKVRRTTRDQAQRARELLARIAVPVLGVALIGARGGQVAPSGTPSLLDRFSTLRGAGSHRRSVNDESLTHRGQAEE